MNTKPFKVNVENSAKTLKELIDDSDVDQLASILEYAFGCKIQFDEEDDEGLTYIVEPTEGEYCGGLDDIELSERK